jgi:hypothetical protein
MSHESKTTTDHDEIRRWAEERGGKPATVEDTERPGEKAGLLRIDFPGGASNPPLKPISWDAFFKIRPGVGLPGREGRRRDQHVLQIREPRKRPRRE